jgi:DNA polymerase
VTNSPLQIHNFSPELENLQKLYGNPNVSPIIGGGCIHSPKIFFLFMNPTAKNIAADLKWPGIKAPWVGTKNIWKLIYQLGFISDSQFDFIRHAKPNDWSPEFAKSIYTTLSQNKVYITNLAKCTQDDARPLPNKVFKQYLELTKQEISLVSPLKIISFGVQVSSVLLGKNISIKDETQEELVIGSKSYQVYPTYYPVGQGMRNMPKAISRIKSLL